jgi:hypothetical protein
MTEEGIYYFTASIADSNGNLYTDTAAITVLPESDLDALLRGKWEAMKNALMNKDVEKAMSHIIRNSNAMFRYNFDLMKDLLPAIIQEMGDIEMMEVEDRIAEYEMIAVQDGTESSFTVKFIKDIDGLWKISFF